MANMNALLNNNENINNNQNLNNEGGNKMKGITRRNIKTYENDKVMYFKTDNGWFYIEKQQLADFMKGKEKDFYIYEPDNRWNIEEDIEIELLEKCQYRNIYDGYEYLSLVVTYLDKLGERTYDCGCFTSYKHCYILYKIFGNFDFRKEAIKLEIYRQDYNGNEYVEETDSCKINLEAFVAGLYSEFFEDYVYDIERTNDSIKIYPISDNNIDEGENEYDECFDDNDKEDIYWHDIYECYEGSDIYDNFNNKKF